MHSIFPPAMRTQHSRPKHFLLPEGARRQAKGMNNPGPTKASAVLPGSTVTSAAAQEVRVSVATPLGNHQSLNMDIRIQEPRLIQKPNKVYEMPFFWKIITTTAICD